MYFYVVICSCVLTLYCLSVFIQFLICFINLYMFFYVVFICFMHLYMFLCSCLYVVRICICFYIFAYIFYEFLYGFILPRGKANIVTNLSPEAVRPGVKSCFKRLSCALFCGVLC